MSLEEAKRLGNEHLKAGRLGEAVAQYSECITLAPNDAVYWSNRSAAYAALQRWDEALADGHTAADLRPDWSKAHSRIGFALNGMGKCSEAMRAYAKAVELDPKDSTALAALEAMHKAVESEVDSELKASVIKVAEAKVRGAKELSEGKVTAAVGSYEQTLKSMQELASKLPPDLAADMQLKIEQVRSNMHQELEMSRLAEAALQPAASAHRS